MCESISCPQRCRVWDFVGSYPSALLWSRSVAHLEQSVCSRPEFHDLPLLPFVIFPAGDPLLVLRSTRQGVCRPQTSQQLPPSGQAALQPTVCCTVRDESVPCGAAFRDEFPQQGPVSKQPGHSKPHSLPPGFCHGGIMSGDLRAPLIPAGAGDPGDQMVRCVAMAFVCGCGGGWSPTTLPISLATHEHHPAKP